MDKVSKNPNPMITNDLYHKLLAYSRVFCKDYSWVDPVEIVHEIILKGGITENNFSLHFTRIKYHLIEEYRNRTIPLFEAGTINQVFNNCQYCYHCHDYLPLDAFYKLGNKLCKFHQNKEDYKDEKVKGRADRTDWHREQKMKSRQEIRDAYVIDVLKKNGYSRDQITDTMIREKKKQLYLKRQQKLLNQT